MSENRNFLGIDTSNYTTSAALSTPSEMISRRKLLSVRPGERGLRQSDAVFAHIKQIPELLLSLPTPMLLSAVGVSTRPRTTEGSYMPCFLAGVSAARAAAQAAGCPLFEFSHQQGHIAAGLWSCGREDLVNQSFLAFHVSGGTTELLLCRSVNRIERVGVSLDLNAGQLIDRVGVLLGYSFPCGAHMDADAAAAETPVRHKVRLKDGCCSLSGYENKAKDMLSRGVSPAEIAYRTIDSVCAELEAMVDFALQAHSDLPLLMVGGVCSNSILRRRFSEKYGALFAENGFSCDNAAGIARLAKMKFEGVIE